MKLDLQTHYMSTGVLAATYNNKMPWEVLSPNGVRLIPFKTAPIPDGYKFFMACDHKDAPMGAGMLVMEILDSPHVISKYAFFTTSK